MTYFTKLGLMTAGLVVALGLATAKAGEPTDKSKALTDQGLKEMLDNLGLAPVEVKSTSGNPMYQFTLERDNWQHSLYVSLSPDKSRIWVISPVADLPAPEKLSAAALEKLLAVNDEIGPSYFGLKGRRMYLQSSIDNMNVTPKQLRKEIDNVMTNVRKTSDHWKDLRAKD